MILFRVLLVLTVALVASCSSLIDFEIDKDYEIGYRVAIKLTRKTTKGDVESKVTEQDFSLDAGITMRKQNDGLLKCNMTTSVGKGFVMDEDFTKPFFASISAEGELQSVTNEDASFVSSDIKRDLLTEFFRDRTQIMDLFKNKTVDDDFRVLLPLGLCRPKIDVVRIDWNAVVRVEARASDCKRVDEEGTINMSATRVEIHYKKEKVLALLVVTEIDIYNEEKGDRLIGVDYERFVNYDAV